MAIRRSKRSRSFTSEVISCDGLNEVEIILVKLRNAAITSNCTERGNWFILPHELNSTSIEIEASPRLLSKVCGWDSLEFAQLLYKSRKKKENRADYIRNKFHLEHHQCESDMNYAYIFVNFSVLPSGGYYSMRKNLSCTEDETLVWPPTWASSILQSNDRVHSCKKCRVDSNDQSASILSCVETPRNPTTLQDIPLPNPSQASYRIEPAKKQNSKSPVHQSDFKNIFLKVKTPLMTQIKKVFHRHSTKSNGRTPSKLLSQLCTANVNTPTDYGQRARRLFQIEEEHETQTLLQVEENIHEENEAQTSTNLEEDTHSTQESQALFRMNLNNRHDQSKGPKRSILSDTLSQYYGDNDKEKMKYLMTDIVALHKKNGWSFDFLHHENSKDGRLFPVPHSQSRKTFLEGVKST